MTLIPLTQGGPPNAEDYEYQWSGEYVRANFVSNVGKKRIHNEDSCIICAPEDRAYLEERGLLLAVADGMGGASAGEYASRQALMMLVEEYYAGEPEVRIFSIPAQLKKALQASNRRLYRVAQSEPEYKGMGTTVSAVVLHGDCAYIAQVGDSRVYMARGHKQMFQITDDHSLVAEQVRNGFLSEQEARTHSLKNLITRAVGIKEKVKVDLFAIRVKQGDTLVICSDGLSNMVEDAEICRVVESDNLHGAARQLVGHALTNGGIDNITVALIRITQPPPARPLHDGATEVEAPGGGFFANLRNLLQRGQ